MNITLEWLKKNHACSESIKKFKSQDRKSFDLFELIELLKKKNKLKWSLWLIISNLNKKNNARLAVFCAKQVLPFFENKHPKDKRPRKALDLAEECLTDSNNAVKDSAKNWANAASIVAETSISPSAIYSAKASASATNAAIFCSTAFSLNAIYSAIDAISVSSSDDATDMLIASKLKDKIFNYGIGLLQKK